MIFKKTITFKLLFKGRKVTAERNYYFYPFYYSIFDYIECNKFYKNFREV